MKKEKIIRVRITADVAEKLQQVGNVSATSAVILTRIIFSFFILRKLIHTYTGLDTHKIEEFL